MACTKIGNPSGQTEVTVGLTQVGTSKSYTGSFNTSTPNASQLQYTQEIHFLPPLGVAGTPTAQAPNFTSSSGTVSFCFDGYQPPTKAEGDDRSPNHASFKMYASLSGQSATWPAPIVVDITVTYSSNERTTD